MEKDLRLFEGGCPHTPLLCSIDSLIKSVEGMEDLTDEQKTNLISFLEKKKKIIEHGELRDQHFSRLDELGFGNGGVVLKVEHKPSGIVMARKVGAPADAATLTLTHSCYCSVVLMELPHFEDNRWQLLSDTLFLHSSLSSLLPPSSLPPLLSLFSFSLTTTFIIIPPPPSPSLLPFR